MALYRVVEGSFSVTPTKSAYSPEEDVILGIKCQVQRKNGTGAWLTWSSDYEVYSKAGELLGQDSREHSMAPWTDIDTADDNFNINLGAFSPGKLEGNVRVSAHG